MASQSAQARAGVRAAAERGPSVTITDGGKTYTLAVKDMTAMDVRALREATGHGYNRLIVMARDDMDVDILAAIVWMSRRVNGEHDLSYDDVAAGINYSTDWEIDFDFPDPPPPATIGTEDSPEA